MTLTILEVLYIILIIFSSVIWTLLVLVLIKVLKILEPITEIVSTYDKVKNIFKAYANIPDMIKEKTKEFIFSKKEK